MIVDQVKVKVKRCFFFARATELQMKVKVNWKLPCEAGGGAQEVVLLSLTALHQMLHLSWKVFLGGGGLKSDFTAWDLRTIVHKNWINLHFTASLDTVIINMIACKYDCQTSPISSRSSTVELLFIFLSISWQDLFFVIKSLHLDAVLLPFRSTHTDIQGVPEKSVF